MNQAKLPKVEEIKLTEEKPLHPLEIIGLKELFDSSDECPAEIVEGLIHQGSKISLNGGSKSYKTWAMIDLALSVATGEPWWGFNTAKGKVLFVNFEIQDCFFCRRVQPILKAKKTKEGLPKNFRYVGLRGKLETVERFVDQLILSIQEKDYSLIVLDPLYKLLGRLDENRANDIASLLNEFEKLAVRTGAAVLYGHHFSKGNQAQKDVMDRSSGSGVLARDPDTLLTMTKHSNSDGDAYTVDVVARNLPLVPSFVVRWDYPLLARDDSLNPADLKTTMHAQKYRDEDLLALLPREGLPYCQWQSLAKEQVGISLSGFSTRHRSLKTSGKIKKLESRSGDKWIINGHSMKTSFKKLPDGN